MKIRIIIPAILAGAIYLIQCSNASDNTGRNLLLLSQTLPVYQNLSLSNTYAGTKAYDYYLLDTTTYTNLKYTLDLGGSTKNVYFIFTNTDTGNGTTYPKINSESPVTLQELVPAATEATPPKPDPAAGLITGHSDKHEVSDFNHNPYAFLNKINPVNMLLNIVPPAQPSYSLSYVTQTKNFYMDSNTVNVTPATCRKVVYNTSNGKTLSIWVANDCWNGSKSISVTQPMVDALANKFLHTDNTDIKYIYYLVTNIFGAEWGPHSVTELIGTTNEIAILLCDIGNDNLSGTALNNAQVTLGYFWGKDNAKQTYLAYSNEMIMFYIDALILATSDTGNPATWTIGDKWPSLIVSTLAHEFQHMIHFYQKTVLLTNGVGSETWIDEMCSMATEDLVADKLGTIGPRGVDSTLYPTGSAGIADNTDGWLPLYNYYNDMSPLAWYSSPYTVVSYALNYALGAYLGRNYGGAAFFGDVVRSPYTDYTAIVNAMAKHGSNDSFGTMLRKWAVANLLSNMDPLLTPVENPYQYNIGNWFQSDTSPVSTTYDLGSINLYNYQYAPSSGGVLTGPYIYTALPTTTTMQPATNVYYRAGSGITGKRTWNISLTGAVRMTVVIKN